MTFHEAAPLKTLLALWQSPAFRLKPNKIKLKMPNVSLASGTFLQQQKGANGIQTIRPFNFQAKLKKLTH
jgi:hypothetical protein